MHDMITADKHAPRPSKGACRILSAAEKLFSKHGFAAVSMSAIAKEAKMSKANIYHHFRTKDQLHQEVLRTAAREIKTLLENAEVSGATATARLKFFAKRYIEGLFQHADMARLIMRELLADGRKRGREMAESGFAQNFSALTAMVRKGQQSGELRKDVDPALVAVLLQAANVFFFQSADVLRHYREIGFAGDPDRYVGAVTDIMLNGLKPRHD